MSKGISSVSSAIAIRLIEKSLKEGKAVEIPSLGIKLILKDGKIIQLPLEDKDK